METLLLLHHHPGTPTAGAADAELKRLCSSSASTMVGQQLEQLMQSNETLLLLDLHPGRPTAGSADAE
jgi:hypothetical protein